MKTRIISALLLIPLMFFVIVSGGWITKVGACAIAILAMYEFTQAYQGTGVHLSLPFLSALTLLLILPTWKEPAYLIVLFLFIILFSQALLLVLGYRTRKELSMTLLLFVYIPVSLYCVSAVRMISLTYVWYVMIFAFVTDTCAYFAGRRFGKHKLIPTVSPNKTVEGALGGILGCMVASGLYAALFHPRSLWLILPASVLGSVLSQLGDLFASSFKRSLRIKDYSDLIPGHGGMLDRIDSILFTGPFVFMLLLFFSIV